MNPVGRVSKPDDPILSILENRPTYYTLIYREENLIETNTKRILQASVHKHLQRNLISDDFSIRCWFSTRTESCV